MLLMRCECSRASDHPSFDGDLKSGDNVSVNRREFFVRLGVLAVASEMSILQALGKSAGRPVIIEAGRRVDAPDAQVPRFPPSNVSQVSRSIKTLLGKRNPLAVVCSAACGADLLLLQAAVEMNIDQVVLLPSEPEAFRKSSVTDRPGNWAGLYDQVLKTAQVEILRLPEGQEGYLDTNLKLLDRGQQLARENGVPAEALVVWNGISRGTDDVTAHFLHEAKSRNLTVLEIPTV
jgi:hypothetical protein